MVRAIKEVNISIKLYVGDWSGDEGDSVPGSAAARPRRYTHNKASQ